jgi:hypothetical protein
MKQSNEQVAALRCQNQRHLNPSPASVLTCLCLLRAVSGNFGTNFPQGWLGTESSGTRRCHRSAALILARANSRRTAFVVCAMAMPNPQTLDGVDDRSASAAFTECPYSAVQVAVLNRCGAAGRHSPCHGGACRLQACVLGAGCWGAGRIPTIVDRGSWDGGGFDPSPLPSPPPRARPAATAPSPSSGGLAHRCP